MNMGYSYSDGQKGSPVSERRETADVSEVVKHLHNLTQPRRSLLTSPPGVDGYLDFYVREDGSIEMEIMERGNDDFATV